MNKKQKEFNEEEIKKYVKRAKEGDEKAREFLYRKFEKKIKEIFDDLIKFDEFIKGVKDFKKSKTDTIKEGLYGLDKAIEKYDFRKGYLFEKYAAWWIRQAIKRFIISNSELANKKITIRTPATSFLEPLDKRSIILELLYPLIKSLKDINVPVLSQKEKEIIAFRYCLSDVIFHTYEETAKKFNTSRAGIIKIENKLYKFLKRKRI